MPDPVSRPLHVFLCHASQDKPAVRELYNRLKSEDWIAPWLDEEELLPGMNWDLEIYNALRDADVIIICLSNKSISKEGYVQREFKRAVNFAEEKPHGIIYIIPLRLDDCKPPTELRQLQWLDYFSDGSHDRLLKSLKVRAKGLNLILPRKEIPGSEPEFVASTPAISASEHLDLYRFVKINLGIEGKPSYEFWIGKYPVTQAQYSRFVRASDFASWDFWLEHTKYDSKCNQIGRWGKTGWDFLQSQLKQSGSSYLTPAFWRNQGRGRRGQVSSDHPVVGISWFEANAYCEWLAKHWIELPENEANPELRPRFIRLPLETEWVAAAGGDSPKDRYPWDLPGSATTSLREILRRTNVGDIVGRITTVTTYPDGASPYGVMDLAGNVWEWQANCFDAFQKILTLRGGHWKLSANSARVDYHSKAEPTRRDTTVGFRVVVIPLLIDSSDWQ